MEKIGHKRANINSSRDWTGSSFLINSLIDSNFHTLRTCVRRMNRQNCFVNHSGVYGTLALNVSVKCVLFSATCKNRNVIKSAVGILIGACETVSLTLRL